MKTISFTHSLKFMKDFHDIQDPSIRKLCLSSVTSIENAYAPYSKYDVGASILLEDESIVIGSNQENAVYPLGLCAERVAIFSASTQYPNLTIKALAVATKKVLTEREFPPFPCGSCRQVILELEQRHRKDIELYVIGSNNSVCILNSVKDILPFAFDKESL